jgi:hypothetical protein
VNVELADVELSPKLLRGRLTNVTEAGATIELTGRMGVLHLPLRCILTTGKPAAGDKVEIYLSYARQISSQGGTEAAYDEDV